ncbi:MAG: MaoC family dehydratase N-terminal domain-containing protein [Pseudomonadales bacterium]
MPLDSTMVGASTRVFTHQVDARWLMAYAAGVGDLNPRYMDSAAGTVMAHPVFPVCLEWPVILSSRELPGYENVTRAEAARGVHAAHDLHLLRTIRAGDELHTTATVIGLESIGPGARQMTRLDTVDARTLVCLFPAHTRQESVGAWR